MHYINSAVKFCLTLVLLSVIIFSFSFFFLPLFFFFSSWAGGYTYARAGGYTYVRAGGYTYVKAGGYTYLRVGGWLSGFQARSKDREILEEGGGAGPSLLPRRDHE